jgi:hypothetical protein
MSAIFPYVASGVRSQTKPVNRDVSPWLTRAVLMAACVAAVVAAAWVGQPAPYLQADPGLAQLMRGMALIKAAIALGAVALLLWRFGWPTGKLAALAYAISAALMAGATMLIWQLSFIPLAAALFHIGALVMLLVGWRDQGPARSHLTLARGIL